MSLPKVYNLTRRLFLSHGYSLISRHLRGNKKVSFLRDLCGEFFFFSLLDSKFAIRNSKFYCFSSEVYVFYLSSSFLFKIRNSNPEMFSSLPNSLQSNSLQPKPLQPKPLQPKSVILAPSACFFVFPFQNSQFETRNVFIFA